jgi:hypothetical protein
MFDHILSVFASGIVIEAILHFCDFGNSDLAKWRRDFCLACIKVIGSATAVGLAIKFSDAVVKCIHLLFAKWQHTMFDRLIADSETRPHSAQNLESSISSPPDFRLVMRSYRKCGVEEPQDSLSSCAGWALIRRGEESGDLSTLCEGFLQPPPSAFAPPVSQTHGLISGPAGRMSHGHPRTLFFTTIAQLSSCQTFRDTSYQDCCTHATLYATIVYCPALLLLASTYLATAQTPVCRAKDSQYWNGQS